MDHDDETFRGFRPCVPVCDFFEDVRLFGGGSFADFDVHDEVGADVMGRIDVDQLEPTLTLNFLTQWTVFEG